MVCSWRCVLCVWCVFVEQGCFLCDLWGVVFLVARGQPFFVACMLVVAVFLLVLFLVGG